MRACVCVCMCICTLLKAHANISRLHGFNSSSFGHDSWKSALDPRPAVGVSTFCKFIVYGEQSLGVVKHKCTRRNLCHKPSILGELFS